MSVKLWFQELLFKGEGLKDQKQKFNKIRPAGKRKAFCWAPFTSLRLHRNGSVQVCCYHIDFISLQNRSLKDIWFGAEMTLLREQMKQYKMPPACNFCTSNYMAGNLNNINALAYDAYEVSESGYPVFIDFSLYNTCNLNCIMCDASLSSGVQKAKNINFEQKGFDYDDNFLLQLEDFIPHLKRAIFTGGEPFLIAFYFKLWDRILKMNNKADLYVTTNGTVYNQKIEDLLEKGKFNITVSVDSLVKSNYDKIRAGASFEKTLENMYRFANYCKKAGTHFTVVVCPMTINWQDIPEIVEKCNKENWQFSYNVVIKPWHLAIWNLSAEKLEEIINFYEKYNFDPTYTAVAKNNLTRFMGLIELFKSWRELMIEVKTLQNLKNCSVLKKEILEWCRMKCEESDFSDIDYKRIENSLNRIPDIFINNHFKEYLYGVGFGLLVNEIKNYDDETIAEHLTIVGFNMFFLSIKNKKH